MDDEEQSAGCKHHERENAQVLRKLPCRDPPHFRFYKKSLTRTSQQKKPDFKSGVKIG